MVVLKIETEIDRLAHSAAYLLTWMINRKSLFQASVKVANSRQEKIMCYINKRASECSQKKWLQLLDPLMY